MSVDGARLHQRAAELRRAFDADFARPLTSESTVFVDLVAIRVGDASYALRLSEISGLFASRKIEWLPTSVPGLLGLTGLRGALLPVYDLGSLLGAPPGPSDSHWIVVTADKTVGLVFDDCEGHQRVPREDIFSKESNGRERHVREVVRLRGTTRPMVSVASVLAEIVRRVTSTAPRKER
jgi:chemotaxis signal transduction protein